MRWPSIAGVLFDGLEVVGEGGLARRLRRSRVRSWRRGPGSWPSIVCRRAAGGDAGEDEDERGRGEDGEAEPEEDLGEEGVWAEFHSAGLAVGRPSSSPR